MKLNIEGKKALVTGASRGIGEAVVASLLAEGVHVMGASRTAPESISDSRFNFCLSDLSRPSGAYSLIAKLDELGYEPDILVQNVGGNLGYTDPLKTSFGWKEVSDFNLTCAMILNEAFIPKMISRKWGRICHISSIAALENQGPPAYCAAKAALNAYVRSLGRYVAKDNVILTTIMPGAILTKGGYWDDAQKTRPEHVSSYLKDRMASQRFGEPDEVAKLVSVFVSEIASFCPGTSMLVDGGQGRVFFSDL